MTRRVRRKRSGRRDVPAAAARESWATPSPTIQPNPPGDDNRRHASVPADQGEADAKAASRSALPVLLRAATGIGLVAFSLLLAQVATVRVFSFMLGYHFAFAAVAGALLGLGIGAAAAAVARERGALPGSAEGLVTLATAVATVIVALALARAPSSVPWPVLALTAAVPFVGGGFVLATAFGRRPRSSPALYGADLAGAAAGSLGGLLVLEWLDPVGALAVAGAALAAAAATFPGGRHAALRTFGAGWLAVALGLGAGLRVLAWPADLADIRQDDTAAKTMFAALRDPSAGARILETRWSAFGRTDLVAFADARSRAIFVDGGAGTSMLAVHGDWPPLDRFVRDTAYVPFMAGPGGSVLVVGAGGGQDVVMALRAGWGPITAIEVNPAAVDLVRRHADYNGDVFGRPGVEVVVDEARSSIRRSNQAYDLIYLSLVFTQASESLAYVLAENHVYTVEAFGDYLDRLDRDGWLALVLHDDASLSKALATALLVLRDRGVAAPDLARQIAVVRPPSRPGADPRAIVRPLLVVKREPFSAAESERLTAAMTTLELEPVYIPFAHEVGLIADLVTGPQAIEDFAQVAPYSIAPATDDSPFFFNTERGPPATLLVVAAVATAVLAVVLLIDSRRWLIRGRPPIRGPNQAARRTRLGLLFAAIGIAYIMLEIALIARAVLFIGPPTVALAVSLAMLLLGSGIGSLLSGRWDEARSGQAIRVGATFASLLAVVLPLALPVLFNGLASAPLAVRVTVVGAVALVVGLPMGMVFPSGLRLAATSAEGRTAWFWSINGVASVVGSVAAIILAVTLGYSAAFVAAAALYAAVALTPWTPRRTLAALGAPGSRRRPAGEATAPRSAERAGA